MKEVLENFIYLETGIVLVIRPLSIEDIKVFDFIPEDVIVKDVTLIVAKKRKHFYPDYYLDYKDIENQNILEKNTSDFQG